MSSRVCVDASILIKLIVEEPDSDLVDALWRSWVENRAWIVAPSLLRYEVTAVLRKKVHRGQLSAAIADAALAAALGLPMVEYVDDPSLHLRALEIACSLDLPMAYDAHYLALAEALECTFWTADRRLVHQAGDRLAYVRCLERDAG